MAQKYHVELNSEDNLRDLLQEAYLLADEQIIQIQKEINKLTHSVNMKDLSVDELTKLAKSINDFLSMKDKAISKKLDIAKIMNDILSHGGNLNDAMNDKNSSTAFDINSIKKMVAETYANAEEKDGPHTITLNKK